MPVLGTGGHIFHSEKLRGDVQDMTAPVCDVAMLKRGFIPPFATSAKAGGRAGSRDAPTNAHGGIMLFLLGALMQGPYLGNLFVWSSLPGLQWSRPVTTQLIYLVPPRARLFICLRARGG